MKIYIHANVDAVYKNKINRAADEYINNDDAEGADQLRQELVDSRDLELEQLKKKYSKKIEEDRLAWMFYDGGPYETGDLTDDEEEYVSEYTDIAETYDPAINRLRKFLNSYKERTYSRNKNFIGPKDFMTTLFYGD